MRTKLIIACLFVALVAAYGLMGMDYLKQHKEQAALASAITGVTQKLAQTPQATQNLEQKLAAAQASLAAAQNVFPGNLNSTQVIDKILKLADERQVKAIPLATKPWSPESGKGYPVFRLHMTVEGGFSQFVDFISRLEKADFATLVIENLSVTRRTRQIEEKSISASLDVAIYSPVNSR